MDAHSVPQSPAVRGYIPYATLGNIKGWMCCCLCIGFIIFMRKRKTYPAFEKVFLIIIMLLCKLHAKQALNYTFKFYHCKDTKIEYD